MINTDSVWTKAFAATAFISVLPNVLLVFLPEPAKATKEGQSTQGRPKWSLTKLLLCFAVGALLGDVFLHAIPHLLSEHDHSHHGESGTHHAQVCHDEHEHDHDHEHEHCEAEDASRTLLGYNRTIVVQLALLFGFLMFFFMEKTTIYILGRHSHGADASACPFAKANPDAPMPTNHPAMASYPHPPSSSVTSLSATGWLNLLADSLHNLTDGLAVGAAFSAGSGFAMATVVSVLLHELPHEIADYSILVQSGLTKWQAIRMQFATAGAAFLGTFLGLLALRNETVETLLLAGTAGGFLYVATVSVLPEVTQSKSTGSQLLVEMLFFCAGVALMVAMVALE